MIQVENRITVDIKGTVHILTVEEARQLASDLLNALPFPKHDYIDRTESWSQGGGCLSIHDQQNGCTSSGYYSESICISPSESIGFSVPGSAQEVPKY